MKAAKYAGLVLAGLLLEFFGFLGVVLTTGLGFIGVAGLSILLGVLHILLLKVIRKDTNLTTLWYALTAQALPIIGVGIWAARMIYLKFANPMVDFKGLETYFSVAALAMLVLSAAISLIFDRVTARRQA